MALAIFAVPFTEHVGPDFSAIGGVSGLQYTEGGVLKGGYSCVGHVPYPIPPNTCVVRVWASDARIAALAAGETYLYLESIEEPVDPPAAPAAAMRAAPTRPGPDAVQAPKPPKPTKTKAKKWLKDHKHKPKDVDDAIDVAGLDVIDGVRGFHGVTPEQWQAAKT